MEKSKQPALLWVPTLYLAEGLPYTAVISLSVVFFKLLGLTNEEIAFYTSWFYLPWVIKPIWSPLTEMFRNSRILIIATQYISGILLASIALTIPTDYTVRYSVAFFWLIAFCSATHDIAADGFYIDALTKKQQALWVGIRTTFYRIAMVASQGGIVIAAGLIAKTHDIKTAWSIAFAVLAAVMIVFATWHIFFMPKITTNKDIRKTKFSFQEFVKPFILFFKKDKIGLAIAFLLTYRLSEAQLAKMSAPFLLDSIEKGGLALSTEQYGFITGTVGLIAMCIGGILGGIVISKNGFKKWIIPMILILNLPDLFYVLMAATQTANVYGIGSMVCIEQFGYGFGFVAYSIYMLQLSQGENSTSHYSVCTGFMAAGMMLPGMASGWLQEKMGYTIFFIWVVLCAIPSLILAKKIKADYFEQKEN